MWNASHNCSTEGQRGWGIHPPTLALHQSIAALGSLNPDIPRLPSVGLASIPGAGESREAGACVGKLPACVEILIYQCLVLFWVSDSKGK